MKFIILGRDIPLTDLEQISKERDKNKNICRRPIISTYHLTAATAILSSHKRQIQQD